MKKLYVYSIIAVFQWSHFFSEMDRKDMLAGEFAIQKVSMEPLLFGNG